MEVAKYIMDVDAFKSLGAYNQAYNGWVKNVCSYRPQSAERIVVSGKVLHSQQLSQKPLTPWIIVEPDGTVESAHCDCMAGLGESCTHVAALLFYIEACIRIKEKDTVTSRPAYWRTPAGVTSVSPSKACNISFSTAENQRKRLITDSIVKSARPKKSPKLASESEQKDFLRLLANADKKPVVLSVMSDYQASFVPLVNSTTPPFLMSFRRTDLIGSSYEIIQVACSQLSLSISHEQARDVERRTVDQGKSRLWHSLREGRITASNFHAVCHTNPSNPSISLLQTIINHVPIHSAPTAWGLEKEDEARRAYLENIESEHNKFVFMPSGLHLCPEKPFLAATPDGLISCDCCGSGCLEIKCPYTARHLTLINAAESLPNFFLELENNSLNLKKTHKYFYQVQLQMFVTKTDFCDFFVWTEQDCFLERVFFDNDFVCPLIEKSSYFFHNIVLPEIVGMYFSHSEKAKKSIGNDTCTTGTTSSECFCTCRQGEHGLMILCDNEDCTKKWFHYECVGITRAPRGKWFCAECKLLRKKK